MMTLCACATTVNEQTKFSSVATSQLVFIRKCAEPTAWNLRVKIDGKQLASIANDSYVLLNIPVGKHKFLIDWPFLATSIELAGELEFMEGETTYLLYENSISMWPTYVPNTIGFKETAKLHKLDAEYATKLLSDITEKFRWGCG